MRILIATIFILVTAKISAQSDATDQAKALLNSGVTFYQKEDYTKAIQDFSKAIELRTKISDTYLLCNLYLNRAISRMNLGSKDALADANQAVMLKPDFSKAYYLRALIQENIMRNYDKALADIDTALSFKPEDTDFLFLKSNCYRDKKQPEDALNTMNKIITLEPKNTQVLKQRASVYAELHKYEESEKDFLKVLEYQPDDFACLCDLATVLCEQKKFDQALTYYLRAKNTDSTQAYAVYSNIGYFISMAQKNYPQAIEYFDKSIAQNPQFAYAYNNRGYVEYLQGNFKPAMKDIQKSLTLFPKNSYAYKNKALILIAQNKISSACVD